MAFERSKTNETVQQDVLKTLLNQEGLRLTNQRQKIIDLFESTYEGGHLTAEEIHRQLAKQGEKISYSTIYRTLHVMVELGLIQEVELAEGRKYYELNAPFDNQHHHLICVQCGEVSEFEDDRINQVSQRETTDRGFALMNCQFTVYGICLKCQRSYAFDA